MTTAQTARQPILDALVARLETLNDPTPGRLTVYRGELPGMPPLDNTGRVAPYATVFGGAGRLDPNPSLEPTPADHLWSGQITFTAGHEDVLLGLLDDVVPLLHLWSPTIDGLDCGHMRPPPGYDPGPARRDDKARPPRFYTPTLWQLHVTTA